MASRESAEFDGPAHGRPTTPFGWVVDGMNGAGSILIFAVMALIVADVIARDFFNDPINGVAEMVALSIVAIVFLQLASTLRHGRMSRAELFIDDFKLKHPRAGNLIQAVFDLGGAAVCAILLLATWPILERSWTANEFIGIQGVFTAPIWPVKLVIILGAGLTLIQYLLLLHRSLQAAFDTGR